MADAAEEGTIRFSEHTKFVTGLWSSRLVDNTFANVRIIPSDTKVTMFAHSSALALASPFLRHLLVAVDPDEDGIYQIFLPDLDLASVKALLKLIYTGSTVGDLDREVQEMGKVIGLAIDAEEMGASKSPESPEASTVPSPMRDDDSANEEEEEITEESEMKDDFALTVKLEENLSKAKFQDSKKRRRKSSTSAAVIASAAAVSSANAAEKPPPKGKRVLMADLDRSQLTCDVCGKEFQVMYKLKLHKLIHSSSPPFVCSLCGKGFNNKYKMRVHEKHHANLVNASGKAGVAKDKAESNDDVYPGVSKRKAGSNACKFCSAPEFKTKSALNAHLGAAHPNFRRFLCSMCGKGFKGQKGLDHHTNFVCGRGDGEKAYPCPECPAKLGSPRDVRRHMATHGPRQEWKCPNCPTVLRTRRYLMVHYRTVHAQMEGGSEGLPYHCQLCGKSFLKQSSLEDHQNRFHMSVKQFACMFCPRRCATRQDLERHVSSIHRGDRSYRCPHCMKTYAHRANYRQHIRSHKGEKPYKCIPCDKAFSVILGLRKHQKSHQRKGDRTQIISAPKGRRGCMSYIDYGGPEVTAPSTTATETTPSTTSPSTTTTTTTTSSSVGGAVAAAAATVQARPRPQAYIPSAQYIASSRSGVSHLQVIGGDYGEITAYNIVAPGTPTPTPTGQAASYGGSHTYSSQEGSGYHATSQQSTQPQNHHHHHVQQQHQISLYYSNPQPQQIQLQQQQQQQQQHQQQQQQQQPQQQHQQPQHQQQQAYHILSETQTVSVVQHQQHTVILEQQPQQQQQPQHPESQNRQQIVSSIPGTESIEMDMMGPFNEQNAQAQATASQVAQPSTQVQNV